MLGSGCDPIWENAEYGGLRLRVESYLISLSNNHELRGGVMEEM